MKFESIRYLEVCIASFSSTSSKSWMFSATFYYKRMLKINLEAFIFSDVYQTMSSEGKRLYYSAVRESSPSSYMNLV